MAKNYSVDTVYDFVVKIIPWASEEVDGSMNYYAGILKITAKGKNGGAIVPYKNITYLGQAKAQEWTAQEVYSYLDNLCSPLAAKMKDAWKALIDVDL